MNKRNSKTSNRKSNKIISTKKITMEFKGTKGEWEVKPNTRNVRCGSEIVSLGGYLRKYDDTKLPGESWLDMRKRTEAQRQSIRDEQEANAKLIAAAPDLLEALHRVDYYFRWLDGEDIEDPDYRQGDLMEEINQAIEKAIK